MTWFKQGNTENPIPNQDPTLVTTCPWPEGSATHGLDQTLFIPSLDSIRGTMGGGGLLRRVPVGTRSY